MSTATKLKKKKITSFFFLLTLAKLTISISEKTNPNVPVSFSSVGSIIFSDIGMSLVSVGCIAITSENPKIYKKNKF